VDEVTQIQSHIDSGDSTAARDLLPLVYRELRKLASDRLARERAGHSLQPTVLVHEAYLRLISANDNFQWNGRGHFFGAASEAMRRILVEHARQKQTQKRGGDHLRVELDEHNVVAEKSEELIALDEALTQLEERWPEKAKIVKLRYFGGLTLPEASKAIGVSLATGERYWRFARAWLYSQLDKS
jgi:RNA polymerase sigma factor (TIGR02999 family)